jgi:hypothetical protein
VVLGGVVATGIPLLVDEICRVVRAQALGPIQQHLNIKMTALGSAGPVLGGATLALERFLRRDLYPPAPPLPEMTAGARSAFGAPGE